MRKKWLRSIKGFFSPLQTKKHPPSLEYVHRGMSMVTKSFVDALLPVDAEDQHRRNIVEIELARLEQERETANNHLMAQHRVMIMTAIATFIALFSSVSAIFIAIQKETPPAPIVNVAPAQQPPADVKVYVTPQPDKKTTDTPQ